IEIIAASRLIRTAESAAVIGDDAEAGARKLCSLIVPDIGVQRPGVGHHHGAAGASAILHEKPDAIPGLDLEGTAMGEVRQSDSGAGGGNSAKGKVKKAATGGHGQAPLFRGARYAGLTLRQSQAAFSYASAPQNWKANNSQ